MNVQFAVKDGAGLSDRGQSARQPDGAVRRQGDRRAGREDRGAGDGGREAGRPAEPEARAWPISRSRKRSSPSRASRGRSGAVAGNEVDRRSDGDRSRFPGRLPEIAAGRRDRSAGRAARCSCRSRTATRRRSWSRCATLLGLGFEIVATGGTWRLPRRQRRRGRARSTRWRRGGRTSSTRSRTARSRSSSTPPRAGRATRTAPRSAPPAVQQHVPYFTTASSAIAVARAIGAARARGLEVRSLQDYYSASDG